MTLIIAQKPLVSKTFIKNGNVLLAYGLDEEGLGLICDEAIAAYRKLSGDDWGKDVGLYDEAHEEAIKRAVKIVTANMEARKI